MIDLSQILENYNNEITLNPDSQLDLEDILKEDVENKDIIQSNSIIESPRVDEILSNRESMIYDKQEFITPLSIQHLPIKSTTYAISSNHLASFEKDTLSIYNHLQYTRSQKYSQSITYLIISKQQLFAGFEDGQIHVYEIHNMRLLYKVKEQSSSIISLNLIEQSSSEIILISSDLDGNVILIKFEESIFRTKISTTSLINNAEYPITSLMSFTLSNNTHLTLANQILVLTMIIKPTIKIIHVFEKPKSSIDLHFGKCHHQSSSIQALSIQWNSFIQLISFVDTQPWYLSYYSSDVPMLFAKFISETLIIAGIEGGFRILYIPYFHQGKYTLKVDDKATIASQNFFSDICCIRVLHNFIYFISEDSIYQLQVLSWLKYFKGLIGQESPQWEQVLKFLVQVYMGNIKGMPRIQLEEDRKAIQQMSPTIISTILKDHLNSRSLNSCIQFIIKCELNDLLVEIREAAENHNLLDVYYQIIEKNLRKIKNVPKSIFFDLANNLSPESFQILVINLSIDSIDIGYTYEICLNKQIYTPLLYICPRKEEDFITPLNKMFETQKPLLYEKCLWFIEITQNQILFPNDSIPIDVWRKAIRQQLLWLMEVLDFFLSDKLFQILYKFLTHPCLGSLQHEDVYSYFSISNQRELSTCIFEKVSKLSLDQYMLQYLLFTSKILDQVNLSNPDLLFLKIFKFNKQYIEKYNSMPEDLDQILQMIHYLMPHYSLYQQAIENNCVDYIAYCLKSQNKIKEAILSFTNNEFQKLRLYKWLEFQQFDIGMLDTLEILLELDSEKCAQVMQMWPVEVIERLLIFSPTKSLLQVLKLVKVEFKQFTQFKFIELLSTHEPESVVDWLRNHAVNLDEVEIILERTNNIEGLGYVAEQKGQYKKALDQYLEIYKADCSQYLRNCQSSQRVNNSFNNLMRTCTTAFESDSEYKKLYFYIANEIFNKNMHSRYRYPYIISHWCKLKNYNFFNQQFSQLFMYLFKNSPNQLIEILDKNTETFNQIQLKNSFISVFQEFSYERKLVIKLSLAIKKDNIILFENLYSNLNKSNQYQIQCLECEKPMNEEQGILLKCGHVVHASCLQNKYCTKCQNISTQALFDQINIEETKKHILKEDIDSQQLQLLKNIDAEEEDFQIEDMGQYIDSKEIEEMRTMNKLKIFDNAIDDNYDKLNAFIEQHN